MALGKKKCAKDREFERAEAEAKAHTYQHYNACMSESKKNEDREIFGNRNESKPKNDITTMPANIYPIYRYYHGCEGIYLCYLKT